MLKTLQVGEFKTRFSEVLDDIRQDDEVVISYGKQKTEIAVLVPIGAYKKRKKVKPGLLKEKGPVEFGDHFKITDEEFLNA